MLDLGHNFFDKYHCIYFDNFFTSLKLLQILYENKTYACGTFRNGRKGWPAELSSKGKKSQPIWNEESQKLYSQEILWLLSGKISEK